MKEAIDIIIEKIIAKLHDLVIPANIGKVFKPHNLSPLISAMSLTNSLVKVNPNAKSEGINIGLTLSNATPQNIKESPKIRDVAILPINGNPFNVLLYRIIKGIEINKPIIWAFWLRLKQEYDPHTNKRRNKNTADFFFTFPDGKGLLGLLIRSIS